MTCLEVNGTWNELLTSESYQRKGKTVFQDEIPVFQRKLWLACGKGKSDEVRKLLTTGMLDVNCEQGTNSTSPLHKAASLGKNDIVQLLLDKGADPNKGNINGSTPLHQAAERGRKDVVRLLLERGAMPNKLDNSEETPLNKILIRIKIDAVVVRECMEVARLLLDKEAMINNPNRCGYTVLHLAVFTNHKKLIQLLLDKGADPNISNQNGETALRLAIEENHRKAARILYNKGAKWLQYGCGDMYHFQKWMFGGKKCYVTHHYLN